MREFTASIYIIENAHVLLIEHRKLGMWLPPGGHLEPNELPYECALREAKEETGLEVALLTQENIWVEQKINGRSIPRPYLSLLEEIPAYRDVPAHQHIDQIYVGYPVGGELRLNSEETKNLRWFSLEELQQIENLFEETLEVSSHILREYRSLPSDPVCV